jgi:hypothetical protein
MTLREQISRRIGRMQLLQSDLRAVKKGYQPSDLEIQEAVKLQAALGKFLSEAEAEPEPGQAAPGKKGKK